MARADTLIQELTKNIDGAIEKLNGKIPDVQQKVLDEIANIVRDLDYKNNDIAVTVKNIRLIGAIGKRLQKLILSSDYQQAVKEYISSFNTTTTIQSQYLKAVSTTFKPTALLNELKTQSIDATAESLTQNGLQANVVSKIQNVLRTNITTGGSFKDLMEQMRETVVSTKAGDGILERYVKQVTTDALNQYSRNYLQTAAGSLGMEWYQYTGSNIETSRDFCIAMTKKRWFNVKEIPSLLAGDFEEFKEIDGKINDKTGLPQGMIPGTNESNFLINLGGYNCGHRAVPVPASIVPKDVRDLFMQRYPS